MTDKMLPQALDAEQAIIGTCLSYPDAIIEISSILTPEMFYLESNRQLYIAILETAKKTGSSDIISISDYLRKAGTLDSFGGVVGLSKRTDNIVSNAYLLNSVYIVREKFALRQYITLSRKLANIAYQEDLADVIEFAEGELFNISNFTQNKEPKIISRCVDEFLIEVEKIINKEHSLSGVASGFTSLDRLTGGWQPQNLIIIAGRPSMGKTSVALALAKGAASLKFPVGIFSLEMSETELTGRLLSSVSGKSNMELRLGRVDLMDLGLKSNKIATLPIFIDDTPAITVFELKSKIKKLIVRHNLKLVIVDYLQLMKADAGSREQEVSQISRGLKALAKELNIPVIALSQLNRSVEDRSDKVPRLSDLRESGAIEQDADIVAFIYRPAYYNIREPKINGEVMDSEGLLVFDIAKNRNGACNSIPLYHNDSLTVIQEEKITAETVLNEPFE